MNLNSIVYTAFGCLGGSILIYILFKLVVDNPKACLIGLGLLYLVIIIQGLLS